MLGSELRGHVALVSGAGSESGIGMAIARRLGAAGAKLIITASSNRIADRIEELRLEGFEVEGRPTDLTDESQVREFGLWAESVWGRVDILVNNAGMAMQGSPEIFSELATMELHEWNLSLARNLTTAFLLTRAVLPGMRERSYGRIVNISSTTGTRGSNPGEAAYSAAKAAMVGMNMGLSLEVAKQGITVNAWLPDGSPPAQLRPLKQRRGALPRLGGQAAPAKWRRRLHFWRRLTPVTSQGKSSWWMAGTA